MMIVKYSKGRTINPGNFESIRIDIGLELECDEADLDDAFNRIKLWVLNRLAAESTKARSE